MSDDPDLDSAYRLEGPDATRQLYRDWAATYDADFVHGAGYRFPRLVADAFAETGGWPCLDVGCGTGAVADAMPEGAVIDGLDFSPEMLTVAKSKGRYRTLIQADLNGALPIENGVYAGLVSSGTFTHGHVGADALDELVRVMAKGAWAVFSIRDEIWHSMGFEAAFARLAKDGLITPPSRTSERIYENKDRAPDGHGQDFAYLTRFRRR